jgi:serine phosphatase RsbU (regulator of sigma subunit)
MIFFSGQTIYCQMNERQKSLLKQLSKERNDSLKIFYMSEIAFEYEASSLDTALIWYDKAIALARKSKSNFWIYRNYGFKGIVYQFMREYDSSVVYNKKAIYLSGREKDTLQQAKLYCNLGKTYFENDKVVSSIESYKKSLYLSKKIKNQQLISTGYRGLGVCYDKTGNADYALKYHMMAKNIDEKANSPLDMAMDYGNIAAAYMDLNKFDEADIYYQKTIRIYEELGMFGEELGIVYNNQASAQTEKNDHKKALALFLKAKEQFKLSKDEGSVPFINKNIASAYLELGQINQAKKYIDSALMEFSMKSNPRVTINAKLILAEILMKQNNHRQASELLLSIYNSKDSLEATYQKREIEELEIKFQTKEKDILLKQSAAEKKKQDSELSLQKTLNERRLILVFSLFGIGILLLFLFLNRSNNKTKIANAKIAQQKEEVLLQKKLIEEKNEEITSSIRYAQNIQDAILPSQETIDNFFPNNFVFYKPKDIVAGDFYWFEQKDDLLFFAVADCTGHGVPGAMVSVVCHNALNQAVREFDLKDPASILNKTRKLVVSTFGKSENNIKDGMDISLVLIDQRSKELSFSGANNSLWIARKGESEMIKLKADRQAIGFTHEPKPFKTHSSKLKPNDRIYAFTDGFADQFGGENAKKYKSGKMEQFVLSIQDLTLEKQQSALMDEFNLWKGDLEQTDDVCVICIEI